MANLRHLLPYLSRYRLSILAGLVCAVFGAAVSTVGPYILRLAIDEINRGVVTTSLLRYGGLLVVVALADGVFKFLQRMLLAGVSYRVEYDLRGELFRRYVHLDQGFFSRNHTGDLMARATNDLSAVRQFLGPGLNGTATALLTFAAAAAMMLMMNVTLALVVLLLLPISTVVFVAVGDRMRKVFKGVQDQFGAISTRAQENFSGIRTIKAYAQEEAELAVFAEDNARYRQLSLRYVLLSGALWPAMALCLGIVAALILLVGGRLVAAGELTVGELVQFNAYLGLLTFPMIMLGWMVALYQQGEASMGRLIEVLRREPAISSPAYAVPLPRPRGEVVYRGVGVRFAEASVDDQPPIAAPGQAGRLPSAVSGQRSAWMLRDITFTVPAGTSLAIVGATGVGKTTLVNMLARVRDPDAGQVLVDGVDVRDLDLADLRRAVGYVPQETFLFSVPLRENVAFGVGVAHQDGELAGRLDHAVEVSRLVNDLGQFPDGLDTMVGERGVTLSGGQKQRVAIARAVMHDPAILVLDDAMSSVDTHTAAQILAGLREVMRGRTSIIIAQRIATVKDAGQIIVLHEGAIVERGTHAELLRLGGRYAAMYRRELLEAELSD
ncbi:MAG: ABC transporter ATP-binding protein [Chloroflexales bacterium]|nr:ABC transporter ATP-binding protein [Chloroflexales bacterium]